MKSLILVILVLASLLGCTQSDHPIVGSWSYSTVSSMVTYTFSADKSCSLTELNSTTGEAKIMRGTYAITSASVPPSADGSPSRVSIAWQGATTPSMLPAETMTDIAWDQRSGVIVILRRQ